MALTRLKIVRREPFAGGRRFAEAGAYERIDAVAHYAVDPGHSANAGIVDLDRAERDGDGPRPVQRRCHLPRAGGPRAGQPRPPPRGAEPGQPARDAIVQHGRRSTSCRPTRSPSATDSCSSAGGASRGADGSGTSRTPRSAWAFALPPSPPRSACRPAGCSFASSPTRRRNPSPSRIITSARSGNHAPIPPFDPDEPGAALFVREHLFDAPARIPRDRWSFEVGDASAAASGPGRISLAGGFEAGRIYDLVYTPAECPVVGAGLLAVRDLAAWTRASAESPAASRVDHVIAKGVSQCGRFLRTLLHAGLNRDEAGNRVFDGVHVHVAGGRRGEFNHRYGQPSVQPTPSLGHRFPFADEPQTDPRSGKREGLLDRLRAGECLPKIVYSDTSAEYWRGDAGLAHHDLADGADGGADVEPPAEVRRYLFAGTQHGPGVLPFTDRSMFGSRGANRFNAVDYRPLLRAALENLRAWIAEGVEPPASVFPRTGDGTAARRGEVLDTLAGVPGFALPRADRLPSLAPMDLGEHAERGVPALPARFVGDPYPSPVSAVDADGNETGGIRMPDVSVPVATHAGFNPRHPEGGGDGQLLEYLGSTVPLARTAEERAAARDPRPSVAERYASRDAYLAEVRKEAERLVESRYPPRRRRRPLPRHRGRALRRGGRPRPLSPPQTRGGGERGAPARGR